MEERLPLSDLSILIAQLKDELLKPMNRKPEVFYVKEAEIELGIAIRREAGKKGSLSISILGMGGGSGEVTRTDANETAHKLTLRLVPLKSYEEAKAGASPEDMDASGRLSVQGDD